MHFNNDFKVAAQIMDKHGYRQFIPFKSWDHCWKSYLHEAFNKRYLYEVILSDKPCKPYLDIEWKVERSYDDKHLDFINKIQSDLITIFHNRYNITINNNNISILTAHNDEKVSFHININCKINGKILSYKTNQKKQQNSAWDLYIALMDIDNEYYKNKIDESVYSLDREFRTIYSTKYGSSRPLMPFNNDISRSKDMINNFEDYFITFTDDPYYINTPEYISLEKKTISKVNTISEIKSYHVKNKSSDKITERLLELLHNIHPTAYYTNKTSDDNGWRFSYTDRNEPCFTGHHHKNNGFAIYIKEYTGEAYMHCHSNKCSNLFKLGFMDRDTTWKAEALKINMQYLDYKETLKVTDIFDEKGTKFYAIINDFIKSGGTYAIKSSMGTGKTKLLTTILPENFSDKKILYLSHRQTFTQNIDGSFNKYGFHNYLNDRELIKTSDKLILQIDSIKHLLNYPHRLNHFDVIILDEIESLLAHLNSDTLGEWRMMICKILQCLIKNAKWVLALDADFNDRAYDFLNIIKEKPKVIINEYKTITKKFLFSSNYNLRKHQIDEDIKCPEGRRSSIIQLMS